MKPVKILLMLPVYFIGLLILIILFTVLNKAYWDARVRYLCLHEGGVTVFEAVDLGAPEYADLPRDVNGIPPMPTRRSMNPRDPFYLTSDDTSDTKWAGLSIARFVESIVRTSDNKTLGTRISYRRSNGDLFNFSGTGSGFSCSSITSPLELPIQVFNLEGA